MDPTADKSVLGPWLRGAEAISGSAVRLRLSGLPYLWGRGWECLLLGALADSTNGRARPNGAVAKSTGTVFRFVAGPQSMSLSPGHVPAFSQCLSPGFYTLPGSHNAPTKAFLSVNSCQIIFAWGGGSK